MTDPETRLQRTEAERDALDRAVLATLGMADRLDELKRSVDTLVDARKAGAGDRTSSLVNGTGVVDLQRDSSEK